MLNINNVATQDTYVKALTMESLRGGGRFTFTIANASAFVKIRPKFDPASGAAEYGNELLFTPSQGGFEDVSGVQFRSAIAGTPARIIAQLFEPGDAVGMPGTSFFATLAASGAATSGLIPAGLILPHAGTSAPAGFVACDGSLVDGTTPTYLALWQAIGLTWGGTGQSSFALPDLRGRVIAGQGTNADVNTIGENDGVAVANRSPRHNTTNNLTLPNHIHSHTLTLPNHAHSITDPGHTHDLVTGAGTSSSSRASKTGDTTGAVQANGAASKTTGITIGNPTTNPAIDGAIGNPTTNPAIGGSIGPGGTLPVDTPAYGVCLYVISLG